MRRAGISFAVVSLAGLLGATVVAPASRAADPLKEPKPGSALSIASLPPTLVRWDRQASDLPTLIFRGADSKTWVRVDAGDGVGTRREHGTCSVERARQKPDECLLRISLFYPNPGTYSISARFGKRSLEHVIEVAPRPDPWRPPAGWLQPGGWSLAANQATFVPCQTIEWYFDRTGEPADRVGMRNDVASGLAGLAAHTGLTFTETAEPALADLTLKWENLEYLGPNIAGTGGTLAPRKGNVSFSSTHDWTKDVWAGNGFIRIDDYPSPGTWRSNIGRQALVLHEVMHALGLGHVDDATSIMNREAILTPTMNDGDIEGLMTLYANNPCPRIPD